MQPVDGSGDPATCGTCRNLLTDWCHDCKALVMCYRAMSYAQSSIGENRPPIAVQRVRCGVCDAAMGLGLTLTEKEIKRNDRRRRTTDKRQRAEWQRQAVEQVEDSRRRTEAELAEAGVLLDGCALCDEPKPESKYPELPPAGWYVGKTRHLGWIYCPDHAALGQRMDETLIAILRREALDLRQHIRTQI